MLGARTRPTGVLPDVKSSLPKYGGPLEHRAADADAASGCQYSTAVRCRLTHARGGAGLRGILTSCRAG